MAFKKVSAIIILLSTYLGTNAQQDFEQLNRWLDQCGMEFSMPEGYEEIEFQSKMFTPVSGNTFGIVQYNIINRKNDVLIGFTLIPFLNATEKDLKFMLAMTKAANPEKEITLADMHFNNRWKRSIEGHIDSSAGPPVFFDQYQTSQINADTAAVFQMKVDDPYQGRYTKCKYLLIHRDNKGDGRILYLYHEDNAHLVDDEIKRTWGLLKFREDRSKSE